MPMRRFLLPLFLVACGSGASETDLETASCDGLAIRYTVPLEIDTYMLAFGPTDIASITLVSEESDDDL